MADTVMADAFVRAGWHKSAEAHGRLREMMLAAVNAGSGIPDRSCGHFKKMLEDANDASLIWWLFESAHEATIKRLFYEMRAGMAQRVGGEEAKAAPPKGRETVASPPPQVADGEANAEVPNGHIAHAAPSAPDAGDGAISSLPKGHLLRAPSPAQNGEAGADARLPKGHFVGAPASPPLSPAARQAALDAGRRAAHASSGFYLIEQRGRRTLIDDVQFKRLPQLRRMFGRGLYANALQYKVVEFIEARAGGFVPDGARVRDVCPAGEIVEIVAKARSAIEGKSLAVPLELAAA